MPIIGGQRLQETGYNFHQSGLAGCLRVFLYDTPTLAHFDPEMMRIPVCIADQGVESLSVYHPWTGPRRFEAAPGRIILVDRKNKEVEGFTFGGSLEILVADELTTCTLQSPVRIIELIRGDSVLMMLATEVEVLLAQRRAFWRRDKETYEARLAKVEPVLLYAVCLNALTAWMDRLDGALNDPAVRAFHTFLHREIVSVQAEGVWPTIVPALSDVL
jgi:hypothetical protein